MITPRSQRTTKNKSRRKFSFLRFLFFLISITFLTVLIYTLFFSPFLEINAVNINGNKYVEDSSILDKINPEISGKYLNFIKKNNLLLVRTGKIEKEIKNNFRIIREIQIKRKFPSILIVNIIERDPQMVFCGAGDCFVIDENGEAYDNYSSNDEDEKNNFLVLSDESSKKINLGETVLEKKYMEYILEIRQELLGRLEIEVQNDFKTSSLISKDVRVKTKENWEIYFNEDIELEKEIEMLKVVLENEIEKNQRPDLEYVDLRIDNKIYYKFKDGSPSQIAKTTTEESAQKTTTDSTSTDKEKKKKD